MSLRLERHEHERCGGKSLVRAGADGTGEGRGCGLRVFPGLRSRRGGGSPAGQGGSRHRGWCPHHAERPRVRAPGGFDDVVAGRPVQGIRCVRQRLRAGRRVRSRGSEAPRRSGSRWRPNLGGDPRRRGQPRRGQRGIDGAQYPRAGAGHRSRAVPGGPVAVGSGLPRGARDRYHGWRSHRAECRGRGLRKRA